MRKGRYRIYMLREMTCLLVGFYSFLLILGLAALSDGSAQRWDTFITGQQTPLMIAIHGIALIYFLIYQTFAWFELAPKAMPVQIGERKLADSAIVLAHYVAWALLSALIFWLAGVF